MKQILNITIRNVLFRVVCYCTDMLVMITFKQHSFFGLLDLSNVCLVQTYFFWDLKNKNVLLKRLGGNLDIMEAQSKQHNSYSFALLRRRVYNGHTNWCTFMSVVYVLNVIDVSTFLWPSERTFGQTKGDKWRSIMTHINKSFKSKLTL